MPSRAPFLPPKDNPFIRDLCRRALGPLLKHHAGGIEVATRPEDLAALRNLRRQRLLLLPNHPTHFDPLVMLEFANRADLEFHFVAAREVFDCNFGLRGWLSQRIGVYSLIRGAVDRDSFATTQKILSEGRRPLVIFPEGESTLDNDKVIPFEAGVASLALRVQDKLNHGAASIDQAPPLHAAVVAMRTFYHPGIEHAIADALNRLESALALPVAGKFVDWAAARRRIHQIGDRMLALVEKSSMPAPRKGESLDARIAAIKEQLLTKMESFLHLKTTPGTPVLDRVRAVKNAIDRSVHAYGDDEELPPYELRLLDLRRKTFAGFYADVSRLINFLTLSAGYLDDGTPERFAEVIIRLEQEIHGHPRLKHPRTVQLRLGQVRDLRTLSPAFSADKRAAAAALTADWESEMNALLA